MSGVPHTLITRLVIKNYRSLADVEIRLSPLTILVGENGTGKSNTIDVLRFVRDVIRDGFDMALQNRGGLSVLRCWYADETEDISIHLDFEGPQWSGDYGFVFGTNHENDYAIKSERLFIRSDEEDMLLEAHEGKLVRYPDKIGVMSMAHPANAYHAKARYKMTPFLPQLAPFSLRLQAVRHFLAHMNFYDFWPDSLRQPQNIVPPFPLQEDGTNLASTLRELKRTQQEETIVEALSAVVNGFKTYSVFEYAHTLMPKLHYCVQNGRVKQVVADLQHEADGTIRFLAILAALYQERYLSPLTIEEPEKAIYTDALGVLCDVLQEASVSYQVIITTHRPDLIDDLPVDSLLIVEKEDGVTKIGRLSEPQRSSVEEKLFSIGEIMQMEGLRRETSQEGANVCQP